MERPNPEPESEELLVHARWVRGLARRLVRDGADAEDLEQDAWVAALRLRPELVRGAGGADGDGLRAWFAAVLRNARVSAFRREARRRAREAEYVRGRGDVEPSADELVARVEAQERLLRQVRRLPDPYRDVVLRRFLQGHSAARVARDLGRPAATVRSQTARGLALLRQELVREQGGDALAAVGLVALAAGTPSLWSWPALSTLTGSLPKALLAMNATTKTALVGGAVLTLATVAWMLGGGPEREPARPGDVPAAGLELTGAALDADRAPEPGDDAPGPALDVAGARAIAGAPAPEAEAEAGFSGGRVLLRAVDPHGAPLSGAVLGLDGAEPDDPEQNSPPAGPDGLVAFDVAEVHLKTFRGSPTPRTYLLRAPGHATRTLRVTAALGEPTGLGDVVLEPAGSLVGLVVDPDGVPVPGARVTLGDPELNGTLEAARALGPGTFGVARTRTGADGGFVLTEVAVGAHRVWAGADGRAWTSAGPVTVQAHERVELDDLVLEPLRDDERIAGRVLGPDGRPAAGVVVRYGSRVGDWSPRRVDTDAEGRFDLPALDASPHHLVLRGALDTRLVSLEDVRPGTLDLEVRLVAAGPLRVEVRDPDGEPIAGAIAILAEAGALTERGFPLHQDGDATGTVELREPEGPYRVRVTALGYEAGLSPRYDPGTAPDPIRIVLEPTPRVRGRVLAGGRPVAGAWVQAVAVLPEGNGIRLEGFPVRLQYGATGETDAEGRFELARPHGWGGSFAALARDGAHPMAESEPRAPGPDGDVDGLVVHLVPGGSVEGHLLLPPGVPVEGRPVLASRGDGHLRRTRADAEGRFRFDDLSPGPWDLEAPEQEHELLMSFEDELTHEVDCEVESGRTVRCELDLRGEVPAVVRGTFLVNGVPAAGWTVTLVPREGVPTLDDPPAQVLDASGTFEVRGPRGVCSLRLTSPLGAAARSEWTSRVDLTDGDLDWARELIGAPVSGVSATGGQPLLFQWTGTDRSRVMSEVTPDAEGRFTHPLVPVGTARMARAGTDPGGEPWQVLPARVVPPEGLADLVIE